MKIKYPKYIYANSKFGTNGIEALDYAAYDTDIKYIKNSDYEKLKKEIEALKKKVTKIYDYAYGLIEDEYHGTLSLDDEIKELDEYIKETE